MGKTSVAAAERVHATTAPAVAAAANSSAVNARVNDSPNTNVPTMDGGGDETRARSASTFAAASARAWAIFAFASALASSTFAFASARVSARAIFVAHSASLAARSASTFAAAALTSASALATAFASMVALFAALTAASDTALVAVATKRHLAKAVLSHLARASSNRVDAVTARLSRAAANARARARVEHHLRGTTLAHGGDPRGELASARGARGGGGPPRQRAPDAAEHETLSQASHGGARGVREERAVVPGLFLRLRGGGNGDGVRVSGRETRADRGRRVGG